MLLKDAKKKQSELYDEIAVKAVKSDPINKKRTSPLTALGNPTLKRTRAEKQSAKSRKQNRKRAMTKRRKNKVKR